HLQFAIVVALPQQLEIGCCLLIVVALPPQLQIADVPSPNIIHFLAHISWSAHLEILSACNTHHERLFYLVLAQKERLTYRELGRQITAGVYERTLSGNQKLSSKLKDAHPNIINVLKDKYMVDYLQLPVYHNETDIQKGLLTKMKHFILDLGRDFLFVDQEYRVQVGMSDFFIDLLFYHRILRCFVALELKATKFKPEYLGKLEFYLEALDKDVKHRDENPSIGILLCKSTDDEVVEYALSRSVSPTMIAKYQQELIPKEVLRTYLKEIE
ncbi:MAG: PDDEXK nuclease domain-containing protein, partial [Bacteroidota bacterium]|nr:PDDEXK nuclease domain-containing protein [Bacteroidota bacterium]